MSVVRDVCGLTSSQVAEYLLSSAPTATVDMKKSPLPSIFHIYISEVRS